MTIDQRDQKDYYVPLSSLFGDCCECVVNRYGLREGLVKKEYVADIDFAVFDPISPVDPIFKVDTNVTTHHARTVVLAVGVANSPNLHSAMSSPGTRGCCHAMQI